MFGIDRLGNGRAAVSYIGEEGVTQRSLEAVELYIQSHGVPRAAKIISLLDERGIGAHALLLQPAEDYADEVIVLPGFSSGYTGEGAAGLSRLISLLWWHEVDVSDVVVNRDLMERLKAHAVTDSDLDIIKAGRRRGNPRDYVDPRDMLPRLNPWRDRPFPMPLGLFDDRLVRSALKIMSDRDHADAELIKAFRNLEAAVKAKALPFAPEIGTMTATALYRKVFNEQQPILTWDGLTVGAREGRKCLFIGAAQAMRNGRVHSVPEDDFRRDLEELMTLNLLFRFEREAVVDQVHQSGNQQGGVP